MYISIYEKPNLTMCVTIICINKLIANRIRDA